jgi:UDP-N-acetylmuramoyl-L-alanyl-D-glutamate--2,6-diaminopimelate ligase
MFTAMGYKVGLISTVVYRIGEQRIESTHTTPDAIRLNKMMREMVDQGCEYCFMEVSSHSVAQHRIDGLKFVGALFTNLTHDHLDYHGTMTNYYLAKKQLFDSLKPSAVAITNADDPYGLKVTEDCKCKVLTYGIDHDADYRVVRYQLMKDRTRFTLKVANMEYELETNLVARFNISNLVAAMAALHVQGIPISDMKPLIRDLSQIEGRMQRISDGQPFNIIVDFAHTPDGIEKVCQYASAITPKGKRIIAITGSAGKRDTEKRPIFGEILDKYCDMIILTEDDPRNEKPRDIAMDIAAGIKKTSYIIIEDRYDAIRQSIELADPNDTIIILGKGDEKFIYREFGREPYEGDDTIVHETLKKYYFNTGGDDYEAQ